MFESYLSNDSFHFCSSCFERRVRQKRLPHCFILLKEAIKIVFQSHSSQGHIKDMVA